MKVKSHVKVRPRVKIVLFRLIGYQEGTNNSCELKFCQSASEGMKKVPYNYIQLILSKGQGQARVKKVIERKYCTGVVQRIPMGHLERRI